MANQRNNYFAFFRRIIVFILAAGFAVTGSAQTDSLNVVLSAEYDIGFDCPASTALDPTGTIVWVLMESCFSRNYSLRGINIADGSPINDENSDFRDAFVDLETGYINSFASPMGFMPDGTLDIRYNDSDSYDVLNLRVQIDSQTVDQPSTGTFNALVRGFTEYPETTVYNADHTLAVAVGETSFHMLDIQAEAELFQIETEGEAYGAIPSFSPDGQELYIAQFNNPDDMNDYASTLSLYSLPDGELLQTYPVPSGFIWASPDGRYAAGLVGDSEGGRDSVVVVELESGSTSPLLPMYEEPSKVMTCLNDGRDVSDVDFVASGELALINLIWLPDSSGFVTAQSYRGEGAGGGSVCIFNYSRLRTYTVQPEG